MRKPHALQQLPETGVGFQTVQARIRLTSALYFGDGFVQPSHGCEVECIPLVGSRVVRVEIDGAFEFLLSLSKLPFVTAAR
ncbi:MAG: hypothetical protein ABSF54_13270 [Bryobacteraceae bacterium]|jgi:hypothetical protein